MTEEEICRNYLQAADRGVQVEILADLNVTTKAEIKYILESHGIEVRQVGRSGRTTVWTKEKEKRLLYFLQKGLTQAEIADKLGVGRSTIKKKVQDMGISKRKKLCSC